MAEALYKAADGTEGAQASAGGPASSGGDSASGSTKKDDVIDAEYTETPKS
jgi:hypothetical protein